MFSTVKTTYRLKAAPWAQNVRHATQILFMGMFEERYIYPLIEKVSNLYLRFIDDIFLIWTGNTDQLMKFKPQINPLNASVALIETSQLICRANQLTGFYMRATAHRKRWTLDAWIGRLDSGCLDSGRLDSGRRYAWTLDAWTLDDWMLGRLDSTCKSLRITLML